MGGDPQPGATCLRWGQAVKLLIEVDELVDRAGRKAQLPASLASLLLTGELLSATCTGAGAGSIGLGGFFCLTEAGEPGLELCDAGETGLDREGETSPDEVSAEELRREA